jgi:hypothetical protein
MIQKGGFVMNKTMAKAVVFLMVTVMILLPVLQMQTHGSVGYKALLSYVGAGIGYQVAFGVATVLVCASIGSVSGGIACGLAGVGWRARTGQSWVPFLPQSPGSVPLFLPCRLEK